MKKEKFYVVWVGVTPGIYTSWTDCQLQIKGYRGARYKSFSTREEAERAYAEVVPLTPPKGGNQEVSSQKLEVRRSNLLTSDTSALAVDAACSGNPGQMEYRGVHLPSGRQVFHFGPMYGTNNIGEFLAIVHGLALLKQKGLDMPIYSDSVNAIGWVRQKRCKTRLSRNGKSEALFRIIERAEKWLRDNSYTTRILKWETHRWGEIPADFGRK